MKYLVHVIVAVLAQPATKDHIGFLFLGKLSILLVQIIILLVVNWVVWFITAVPVSWVFPGHDRLILVTLTKLKVLVFNHPGVWCFRIGVIDNGVPLVVINIQFFGFKPQAPVLKFPSW